MTKDIFNNKLSNLLYEGFIFNPEWGKWEKRIGNRVERINISYRKYPDSFYIEGLSASIIFEEVENILNLFFNKYNIQQHYSNKTIRNSLNNIEGINYNKFETEINDENTFQIVVNEIKMMIEKGAIPFFKRFDTIEKIADFLAEKKPQDVVPYIQGAILFPKTILILKMAAHFSFQEKLYEYWKILKQQAEKKEIYKQMLIVFEDLFKDDLNDMRLI